MTELTETEVTNFAEESVENLVKAVHCAIPLGSSTLDTYMLPSGEKRIGGTGISAALGYTNRWFYNRTTRDSKWLKDLQATGYTGAQVNVTVLRGEEDRSTRGSSLAKTVSIRDFVKLVTYEAITKSNPQAIALLAAFAETGLEQILEDAFAGRSIDFVLEKIVHFSKWTQEEFEEVLQYNREEVRALNAWNE